MLKKNELPSGTLIVSCSKHITVVKDGVLHDTYDCSRNGTDKICYKTFVESF